jgi:hypothetical protein
MDTHDFSFPQHDGLAPVEADVAGRIIIASWPLAKRAATNGMFGPMSGVEELRTAADDSEGQRRYSSRQDTGLRQFWYVWA